MNANNAESYNMLTSEIIAAAIEVHRRLGPGLLESAYEACLVYELRKRGINALSQVGLPVIYDEVKLDVGYRIDILVEDTVIIELKAVEKVIPLHEAQLISYLKLSGKKVGLLMNFNVTRLKDGITRRVN
ncbi:MAG: GxxExxY protein [Verrucomicrobiaceae bacterium]